MLHGRAAELNVIQIKVYSNVHWVLADLCLLLCITAFKMVKHTVISIRYDTFHMMCIPKKLGVD